MTDRVPGGYAVPRGKMARAPMRVLIAGSGLVGSGIARELAARGDTAILCSRRPPAPAAGSGLRWLAADATNRRALGRAVDLARPDAIVLAHGPSDVTWCEAHPDQAEAAHVAATANLVGVARGVRTVLISSDNVFDGSSARNDEGAATRPANAYGRAKLAAERTLLASANDATVLRVSLVYGRQSETAATWLNYFAECVRRLGRNETVAAPHDHWNTPVLVDDLASVVLALLAGGAPDLLHLGGPDRVSRAQWAMLIADALGVPRSHVVPVSRRATRYACRPENGCLSSVHLGELPATRCIGVRGVLDGIRALLHQGDRSASGSAGV
jgi:dTDP-4-dehydrorhamnose reductase